MNLYSIMLFLHVSGDVGLFIGIGAQLLGLAALRRATTVGQVLAITSLIAMSDPISVISALVIFMAGLYMALTVWGLQTGWIAVALGSIVVFFPLLIRGVIEPRLHAIATMAREAPDGPLAESLISRIHDPILGAAVQTVAALVLGIIFLMTNKPSLFGALVTMIVSVGLGLASGALLRRRARPNRAR